jgi:hypothetical protein
MKIIDHVRGSSRFLYFKDGELWYQTEDTGLKFPVPVSDAGTATFNAQEKSLLLMRYIRKWKDVCEHEARRP